MPLIARAAVVAGPTPTATAGVALIPAHPARPARPARPAPTRRCPARRDRRVARALRDPKGYPVRRARPALRDRRDRPAPIGPRTINTYSGTAVTAVIGDALAYVRCTGTNPTYTIPPNATVAFVVGTQIDGVGTATAMTLAPGAGVTLNRARTLVTLAADSGWTIIKVAPNEWDVHGDFV